MKSFNWLVCVVALCCGMWGCGILGNDDEPVLLDSGFHYDSGFVMVSDSTAIIPGHYYKHYEDKLDDWKECTSEGILLKGCKSWYGENYWEGSLDTCYGNTMFAALDDSTVLYWFWMAQNTYKEQSYFIWKVEKDPVKKRAVWVSDYVDMNSSSTIMRTWKGGKLLFKNYEKFALLDTAENTITQVTKEEAGWPDGVEDAQYFGDDLMTIVLYPNNFSYSIVRNGKDTISTYYEDAPNSYDVVRERFNGRYIIRMKTDAWYVFSTDSSWQISEKPVAKYKNDQFHLLEE
ncbi:MAG: hypothetical protein MJZ20_14830 [Bacteroidaceae bacterium]|nr:hypothetical protein [Bacteroidaceae bacterium]